MSFAGLQQYIRLLEKNDDLITIDTFVDPVLEMTEVADRIFKSGGKAILFTNNGTTFPVLMNMYGSEKRMSLSIGRENLNDAGAELDILFSRLTSRNESVGGKLSTLLSLGKMNSYMPRYSKGRGSCQQHVINEPDLGILPVLKCWPLDGGRFITLPIVHTIHPLTGKVNAGMYRMQILDSRTTGMHWQRHKTGANHFEAWKKEGKRMPVTVALGGDPVYAYSATAPLPEDINEYILAGFLRRKSVKLVKCITNDLYVPEDADIVLEGYVDTSEDNIWEGPFGDHTGFYSLADWYPRFHITCITHRNEAVYPATIVGIPPQEDAFIARATEKIFLTPVKLTLQPEVTDFHMPDAGVAHNLVIVKIRKTYPGQGTKVISALSGAGQMMFTKYMIVVDGNVDIRNYSQVAEQVFRNADFNSDIHFGTGPLDVLDHNSDSFSFGGKAGIDATVKMQEELQVNKESQLPARGNASAVAQQLLSTGHVKTVNLTLIENGIPLIILSANPSDDSSVIGKICSILSAIPGLPFEAAFVVDHTVDIDDLFMISWQFLGNTDPVRDHYYFAPGKILFDCTIKAYREGGFKRKWPNVVCSSDETIAAINSKWSTFGTGSNLPSPSGVYKKLLRGDSDQVRI